jgi:hypothetical protein
MSKMVYLKIKDAVLVKRVGVNPIYKCRDKYYVGLELLWLGGEEAEHCEECQSLQEAEAVASEINNWNAGKEVFK